MGKYTCSFEPYSTEFACYRASPKPESALKKGSRHKLKPIKSSPWKLEEYIQALRKPEFFNSVRKNLDYSAQPSAPQLAPAMIQEMIQDKFALAGHSARWFFYFPSKVVQDLIHSYAAKTDDIESYFRGSRREESVKAANHLFCDLYYNPVTHESTEPVPVSRAVARILGTHQQLSLLKSAKEFFKWNNATNGHFLEMEFLNRVTQGDDIVLLDYEDNKTQKVSYID